MVGRAFDELNGKCNWALNQAGAGATNTNVELQQMLRHNQKKNIGLTTLPCPASAS